VIKECYEDGDHWKGTQRRFEVLGPIISIISKILLDTSINYDVIKINNHSIIRN